MDNPDNTKDGKPEVELVNPATKVEALKPLRSGDIFDVETWKSFFSLTGGSTFYCLSAVFVAYGIVKIMTPVLEQSDTLRNALPCLLTLAVYELALLGVLVLIVAKKVIDDAISVVVLIALFLVGTSMAFGTSVGKQIDAGMLIGLIGIAIALAKFYVLKRFVRIPLKVLSFIGLGIIIAYNYIGPTLMAQSIMDNPAKEPVRRQFWLMLVVAMLIGACLVLIEAVRCKQSRQDDNAGPFLQSPAMGYLIAFILIAASGAHQYSMAYIFTLERVIGDYLPAVAISTLLLLEILRHSGKKFGFIDLGISCVPLAAVLLAIDGKEVLATGEFGFGLICYPPVLLGLSGLGIVVLAFCHKRRLLWAVVFLYALGVLLTAGFSPKDPYDLNTFTCGAVLVIGLLAYGIFIRNQYVCMAGVVILSLGLPQWDTFFAFAEKYNLSELTVFAGAYGLCSMALYLFFGKQFRRLLKFIGSVLLAWFILAFLPEQLHLLYLVVVFVMGLLFAVLWLRFRDIAVISILCVPLLIRVYVLAKRIGNWRFVILGFLMLGVGTVVSLFKPMQKNKIDRNL